MGMEPPERRRFSAVRMACSFSVFWRFFSCLVSLVGVGATAAVSVGNTTVFFGWSGSALVDEFNMNGCIRYSGTV